MINIPPIQAKNGDARDELVTIHGMIDVVLHLAFIILASKFTNKPREFQVWQKAHPQLDRLTTSPSKYSMIWKKNTDTPSDLNTVYIYEDIAKEDDKTETNKINTPMYPHLNVVEKHMWDCQRIYRVVADLN